MPRDSTPPEDLEDWEISSLKTIVNAFVAGSRLPVGVGAEDLWQEAAIHWLKQRGKYRADRGVKLRTFMARVVEHRLMDFLRNLRADKWGGGRAPLSIDEERDDLGGRPMSDFLASPQEQRPDFDLDSKSFWQRLTNRQRAVIRARLAGYDVTEIALQLRLNRSTVYEDLKGAARIYEDESLR